MSLKLRIVSPEKIVFVGDVDSVTVPGTCLASTTIFRLIVYRFGVVES